MLRKPLNTTLHRRLAVWLLVLITVFGALAPTLSHALVWTQGGNAAWTEICTTSGMRWVKLGAAPNDAPTDALQSTGSSSIASAVQIQIQTGSPDGPESVLSLDHCPFCLLLTDRVAPPPHALVHLFAVSGGF